ncbi:MAG: response regulator [Acidobacteriota bacterium]
MRPFRELSIRGKLLRVTALVAGTALASASLLFAAYDVVTFRSALVRRLTSAAQIVGLNSASALLFADEGAAAKTLSALRSEPNVVWAGIYDSQGRLFASYRRDDLPGSFVPPPMPARPAPPQEYEVRGKGIVVVRTIPFDGGAAGAVVIEADLRELRNRLLRYGAIVLLVSLVSFGLALVASARFTRAISEPVRRLAEVAQVVSRQKDYSVRAVGSSGDEIGLLVETFNQMLDQIQRRDEDLESVVETRTRDLARSQALLADAQRIAQIGTWEYDLRNRTLAWSEELYRLYGLDPAAGDPTPDAVAAMTVPEDREAVSRELARSRTTGTAFSTEFRIRRPNGAVRVLVADGNVTGSGPAGADRMVGLVQDVTERRAAESDRRRLVHEQAVRAEAEAAEWRSAVLARVTASLASSLDYERTLAAPATATLPTFADWCVLDVVDADGGFRRAVAAHRDPARAEDAVQLRNRPLRADASTAGVEAIRTGKTIVVPAEGARRPGADPEHSRLHDMFGTGHLLAVSISILGERKGSLMWCRAGRPWEPAEIALAEEIAHRTGVAVEHARLYSEAQQANRLKDEFLATLSHELRTPLHAIVGWAQMLRSGRLDASTAQRAIETIDRNAHVQNQLISDILDVSRIMAGKLRLNVASISLVDVVSAALDTVGPAAQAREVRMEQELDLEASAIVGDADRLQQVVWNLLSNAIKFGPRGSRVVVRLRRGEMQSEIVVEDEGPGIRPEFLPFVFERFRQADSSSTRPHGGLGLGLAIVRHLVELHGGTVEASNRSDGRRGALFTVRLPRRAAVASVAALAPSEVSASGADRSLRLEEVPALDGLRVLVVDDEPDSRDMVATVLEIVGAEALVAGTAAEGLAILVREKPDVLLSDLEMPGEDGYSLIRRIRSLGAENGGLTPAAALTAYAGAEHRTKTLLAGFQLHVAKPVQPAELVAVVANLAARSDVTLDAGSRRVLVVEDDADSAGALEAILSSEGFETRVAFDGPGALEAARSFRPGVVLLDLGLPGMSGLEVARRLKESARQTGVRLVAMTGHGSPEDIARSRDAGFDRHLVKPVTIDELLRILDALFASRAPGS